MVKSVVRGRPLGSDPKGWEATVYNVMTVSDPTDAQSDGVVVATYTIEGSAQDHADGLNAARNADCYAWVVTA